MDRKLDLVVGELVRYRVAMAEIREINWFGSDFVACWWIHIVAF